MRCAESSPRRPEFIDDPSRDPPPPKVALFAQMEWFAEKTVVVTGAAHGIGRRTAELLDDFGARVVAVDRDGTGLRDAFAERDVVRVEADLGGDTVALAREISSANGPIDLLVNNVGIGTPHGFLDLAEDDYDRVFAVNLRGPWFLTRELTSRMIEARRRGSVVFVSSVHDTFIRGYPHYSASKAAVAMLVKELAQALGPHSIRVNAVSPGAIETAQGGADRSKKDKLRTARFVPLGHRGQPNDVARMVAVLLNDEWSGYVTGANVRVDGGLAVHNGWFDQE
jgi:3-oxoacyl-[acyl-carrier protein] reductase